MVANRSVPLHASVSPMLKRSKTQNRIRHGIVNGRAISSISAGHMADAVPIGSPVMRTCDTLMKYRDGGEGNCPDVGRHYPSVSGASPEAGETRGFLYRRHHHRSHGRCDRTFARLSGSIGRSVVSFFGSEIGAPINGRTRQHMSVRFRKRPCVLERKARGHIPDQYHRHRIAWRNALSNRHLTDRL